MPSKTACASATIAAKSATLPMFAAMCLPRKHAKGVPPTCNAGECEKAHRFERAGGRASTIRSNGDTDNLDSMTTALGALPTQSAKGSAALGAQQVREPCIIHACTQA